MQVGDMNQSLIVVNVPVGKDLIPCFTLSSFQRGRSDRAVVGDENEIL